MRNRFAAWTWIFIIALTAAGLTVALSAPGRLLAAEEHEHKHGPLEDAMEAMNKALKTLKTQAADASKQQANLELVAEMQKQMIIAKSLPPNRAAKLNGAEKQKFMTEYRRAMIGLIGELLKLETAVLDGKTADAEAIMKNLNKVKTDSHEKFQEE